MKNPLFWRSYVPAVMIWKNSLTSDGMKMKRLHFSSDKSFSIANFIPQGHMVLRLNVFSLYFHVCIMTLVETLAKILIRYLYKILIRILQDPDKILHFSYPNLK